MSGVREAAVAAAAMSLPSPTMAAAAAAVVRGGIGISCSSSSKNKNTLTHLTQQLRQNQNHNDSSNSRNVNNSFHLNGFDLGGHLYLHSHDFMGDYLTFRQAVRQNKTISRLYVTIPIHSHTTSTDTTNDTTTDPSERNSVLSEMIPLLDAIGTLPNLSEIYWNSTATSTTITDTVATAASASAATDSDGDGSDGHVLRHDLAVLLRVLNKTCATTTGNSSSNLRVLDISTNVPTTRDDLRQLMLGIRAAGCCAMEKVQFRGFGGSGANGDISTIPSHDVTPLQQQLDETDENLDAKENDKDHEYSVENHPLSLLTANLAKMETLQTLCLDPSLGCAKSKKQPPHAVVLPPMNASCLFSLLRNLPLLRHLQLQSIRFDSWGCSALVQYLSHNNNNKNKRILAVLDLSGCSFPPRVMHGNDSIYTNCNETSILESLSCENSTLQQLVLQDVVITDVHQVYKSAAIGLRRNKTLQRFVLEPALVHENNSAVVSAETVHALFAALQTSAVTQLHLPSLPKLVQDASALLVDLNAFLHHREPVVQELVLDIGHVSSHVANNELQALLLKHHPDGHGRLPLNTTLCQWDENTSNVLPVSSRLSSYYHNDWTSRKNIWLRLNRLGRKRLVLQECMVKKSDHEQSKKQQQQQHVATMVEILCQVHEDVDCSFSLLKEFPSVCNRQLRGDLSSSSSPSTSMSKPPVVVEDLKSVSRSATAITPVDSTTVATRLVSLEENAVVVAANTSNAAAATTASPTARKTATTPRVAFAASTFPGATLTAKPTAAAKQKSSCDYNDVAFLVEGATRFRDFITCIGLDSFPEQQQKGVSVNKTTTTTRPTTAKEEVTTNEKKTFLISENGNFHYNTSFSSPRDAREEIIANGQTTTTTTLILKHEDLSEGSLSKKECGDDTKAIKIIESLGEEKKMDDDDNNNSRLRPHPNTMDLDPVFGTGTRHWTNSVSMSIDSTCQDQESVPLSEPESVASCPADDPSKRDERKDSMPTCMTDREAATTPRTASVSVHELSTTSNNEESATDRPHAIIRCDVGGSTQQHSVTPELAKSRIGEVASPCGDAGVGLGKSSTATKAERLGLLFKSSNCPHRGSAAFVSAGNALLASVDSAVSVCLTDALVETVSDAAMNTCQAGEQMMSGDSHHSKSTVSTRIVNPNRGSIGQAVEQTISGGSKLRKAPLSTKRVNQGRALTGNIASGGAGRSSTASEAGLGLINSQCMSDAFADTLSDMAMSTCKAGEDMMMPGDSHRRDGPVSTGCAPAIFGGLASCGVRGELALGGVDSRDATSTREVADTTITSMEKIMMMCLAESVSMSDALSDIAYGGCELSEKFVLAATTSCRDNTATTRGYEHLAVPLPEIVTNSVKGPGQLPMVMWGITEEARRRVSRPKMIGNKSSTLHDVKTSASPRNQELQVLLSAMSNVECQEDTPSVSTMSEGNDHSSYQEMPIAATVDECERADNKSVNSADENELLNLLSALSHVGSKQQEGPNVGSVVEPTEEAIDLNKPVLPPRVSVKRAVAQWEVKVPTTSHSVGGYRAASLSPVSHPSRKSNPGRWLEMDKNSEEGTATCTTATASVSSCGQHAISLGDEDVPKFASTIRFVVAVGSPAAQRPPLPPTVDGTCSRALERE